MSTDNAARHENSERGFVEYSRTYSPGCLKRRNAKKKASESEPIQPQTSLNLAQARAVASSAAIDPTTILVQKKNLVGSVREEASLLIFRFPLSTEVAPVTCGYRIGKPRGHRLPKIILRGLADGEKLPFTYRRQVLPVRLRRQARSPNSSVALWSILRRPSSVMICIDDAVVFECRDLARKKSPAFPV